ncbi:MAG TPA: hypothetical protein VMH39_03115 [Gemmatimonadaceae bacterium]|nr:hypothetical protein [Gemmatimonadaceae bacterium]
MTGRALAALCLVSGVALGCGLVVGPEKGIASISTLVVAAPSVVLGDVLRDSLGAPAPLLVNAYDAAGALLTSAVTTYFVLDSIPTVRVDSLGLLHGLAIDSLGAHVLGQVGGLQTPTQTIFVSVHPDTVAVTGSPGTLQFDLTVPDTLQASNWSDTLALSVKSKAGLGAQGFVVEYSVLQSPAPATAGRATVYIGNDQGLHDARDTTDLHGAAHRRVVLDQFALGDAALLAGTKTDTVLVRASVRYGGVDVPGSPVTYAIPVHLKPATPP